MSMLTWKGTLQDTSRELRKRADTVKSPYNICMEGRYTMDGILPYEDLAQELCTKLLQICHSKSMVLGILSCVVDHEEDIRELLDFINNGEDVDEETVSVAALDIADRRGED